MRALVAALALMLVASAAGAAVDDTKFRWERMVEADGGLSAFEPDGPMYEHARPGFGDLRVLAADGRQVPWRLRAVRGDQQLQSARILNAGTQAGAAVALLDFGPARRVRERITLVVPQEPFVGRAEVAGSDDRTTFTRLSSTAIYDVRGATRAVSTVVVIPPSDFRYYRVRATGVREIRAANAEGSSGGALVDRPATVELRQAGRQTIVDADLGYRNVPVHELRFASSTPAFDRRVEVLGSMDGRAYVVAGGGRIHRFGGAGETTLPLESRYRYLRIRIANGDDEPLQGLAVTLRGYRDQILLAAGYAPPYRVLYGAAVAAPEYDFAQQPEPSGTPDAVTLGPERANEAFEPPGDPRGFAERHPALLTAALALAAAALLAGGLLALRRRA